MNKFRSFLEKNRYTFSRAVLFRKDFQGHTDSSLWQASRIHLCKTL